ncbi:MAG: penicillin acylase family protein [Nitriliruptoraceae bacterium]
MVDGSSSSFLGRRRSRRRAAKRARAQGSDVPQRRRTRSRTAKWTQRSAIGAASLVVIAIVASTLYLTAAVVRSRPAVSGDVAVTGLFDRVDVIRDVHGIPTIVASDAADLWFAQGYVHAQDRFWEMDFRRHVTAGRLSELFGLGQVGTDTFIRTLGWRRSAEAELATFDDETLTMLTAYAEGVNEWMAGRRGTRLSLEHSLLPLSGPLRYVPEPWTPADSVAWIKAMAWDLSSIEDDIERARLSVTDLGPGRDWRDLYPSYPPEHAPVLPAGGQLAGGVWQPAGTQLPPTTRSTPGSLPVNSTSPVSMTRFVDTSISPSESQPHAAITATLSDLLAATHTAVTTVPTLAGSGDLVGSNSWVIAPERSATDGALLANDPHLEPSQPSLWYQVGLQCQPVTTLCPYHVKGYSLAGLPGVIIGRTDHAAWGLTNLGAASADLIVERLDGDVYLAAGNRWLDITTRTETISVAGGSDIQVSIRATQRGPIISDAMSEAQAVAEGPLGDQLRDGVSYDHAISLAWSALEATTTVQAIPRFARLRSWDDFMEATRLFQVPNQGVVYADADGTIGYRAPGLFPVRRTGDGSLPLAGWTGEFAWEGYLHDDVLPWIVNPDAGLIVAANQDVLPAGVSPALTRSPNPGFRSQRILELLGDRDDFTLDDLAAVQLDRFNANAVDLVPALLAIDDQGVRGVAAIQQALGSWDYFDDRDAAGAAAFNATWRHLLALTFHDELPPWAQPSGSARWWQVVRTLLDQPRSPWWDDLTTLETETRDDMLLAAMAEAYTDLAGRFGSDPGAWRWGAMHTLDLQHATFGSSGIGVIEWMFNRGPLETDGGSDVVNAIGWDAAEGYEVSRVPSMRMLVDLSDPDQGLWINLTGQSGRPFTRHYTDQAEHWRLGEYLPMVTSDAATRLTAHNRLTLMPSR